MNNPDSENTLLDNTQSQQYIFVYGVLRTIDGHPVHNYLRGVSDFVGAATVGGTLVEMESGSSGLMLSGNPDEKVAGELYCIHEGCDQDLFEVLDRFEGCSEDDPEPHELFRHQREVILLADGETIRAWVYLYNG